MCNAAEWVTAGATVAMVPIVLVATRVALKTLKHQEKVNANFLNRQKVDDFIRRFAAVNDIESRRAVYKIATKEWGLTEVDLRTAISEQLAKDGYSGGWNFHTEYVKITGEG